MAKEIIKHEINVIKCEFYDKDKGYCLILKMNPKGFKNPSCFSGDFQECIQENKICPNTFCHNNQNCYYKQLVRSTNRVKDLEERIIRHSEIVEDYCDRLADKEKKCEELKKANILIDNNRECKAIKLMEIEKLIISCMSGYTDKFTQEIMDIIRKPETICPDNKYKKALDEIEKICKFNFYQAIIHQSVDSSMSYLNKIKTIVTKAKDSE